MTNGLFEVGGALRKWTIKLLSILKVVVKSALVQIWQSLVDGVLRRIEISPCSLQLRFFVHTGPLKIRFIGCPLDRLENFDVGRFAQVDGITLMLGLDGGTNDTYGSRCLSGSMS
jgi:hypothetical protein